MAVARAVMDTLTPGFYWYLENGQAPTIVEVAHEEWSGPARLWVYFVGNECDQELVNCPGLFIGPLPAPEVK